MSAFLFRNRREISDPGRRDLSIYDGRVLLGHVREEGGRCRATTWPDGRDLGEFRSRKSAFDAISEAHAARHLDRHHGAASYDHPEAIEGNLGARGGPA